MAFDNDDEVNYKELQQEAMFDDGQDAWIIILAKGRKKNLLKLHRITIAMGLWPYYVLLDPPEKLRATVEEHFLEA